jgi:hypothetical protein
MRQFGFCCGTWHMFYPRPIMCNGPEVRNCKVKRGMRYYR